MPLLSGPASVSRYTVVERPEEPTFERLAFREIPAGSEIREAIGFIPMLPGEPYRVGDARFAFRVRIDRLRPDPTAVKERARELERAEVEATGAPFVGARKRRKLRELAEEELLVGAQPRSRIFEGCLDGDLLWLGTTAKGYLGTVVLLLRQIGVVTTPRAPWLLAGGEAAAPPPAFGFVETQEPGQSALGCELVHELLGDRELSVEPESGAVRLQTAEAKVSLSGTVLPELVRFLDKGAAVVSAKLTTGEVSFRFDALSFRVAGLKVEGGRRGHWTEQLDERLERIAEVFDLLDGKYAAYVAAKKEARADLTEG